MGIRPENAMMLAAGLGTRMRPITDKIPKPLVRVFGKTLIDHGLDALAAAEVKNTVVNTHYFSDQMIAHLGERSNPNIIISDESDALLNSGGGITNALPKLGKDPFYLMNADSFWLEGAVPNLTLLGENWDESKMDMLMLLSTMSASVGYSGKGDFNMDPEGQLTRRNERELAPFIYSGAAIIHPRLFNNAPDGAFSLNALFDEAIENGRLYGISMGGLWLHVGTPEAIQEAEIAIAKSAA